MASRSGAFRVKNRSAVCPDWVLRGLEDWRLKITAANVRVYKLVSIQDGAAVSSVTYSCLLCQLDLF